GKALVLAQSLGEAMAAVDALPARVGGPDGGRGDPREIGPHHKLDRQKPALLHDGDARVRHREEVVRRNAARLFEPEGSDLIQHLALEGKGAYHDVEAAHAVRDDDGALVSAHIAVPNLPLIARSELPEVGPLECLRALLA